MSIEKHPTREGYYYVKHYPNGRKGKAARTPVEGYGAAQALDNSLKNSKGSTISAPAATHPRLADIVDEYLKWCRTKWSAVTMKTKEHRLTKYIIPHFGAYRVRDLNQRILDSYRDNMKKWMYSCDHSHLFALITWMIRRGYAEKLTWFPERITGNHAVKPVPHPSDILRAIDSMPKESHRALFKTMLFTGLRWNEARNIKWEDIDFKTGSIRIKEVVDGPQDIIYIPEPLMNWFIENQKEAGFVFESAKIKGQPVKNLWNVLKNASAAISIHISPHTFRHASGTYLYEQTNDLYQVQAHLRHKKIATTQIYARMSVSRRQSAVNSIIDYVNDK